MHPLPVISAMPGDFLSAHSAGSERTHLPSRQGQPPGTDAATARQRAARMPAPAPRISLPAGENAPEQERMNPQAAPHTEKGTGPSWLANRTTRDHKDGWEWNDRDRNHPRRKHDKDLAGTWAERHQYNHNPQPHDDGAIPPRRVEAPPRLDDGPKSIIGPLRNRTGSWQRSCSAVSIRGI